MTTYYRNERDDRAGHGYRLYTADGSADLSHYGDVRRTIDLVVGVDGCFDVSAIVAACVALGAACPFDQADLDPTSIVDTAGCWDDTSAVEWLWERVLEQIGCLAVITRNGAIVFDGDY